MRLIDADALNAKMYHEAFETDTDFQRWDSGCWIRYKMFENALKDAPTIESEQRKGEWCHQNDDYYDWYECSECGYGSEGEMIMSSEFDVRTNYCPNCGADMRGGQDE